MILLCLNSISFEEYTWVSSLPETSLTIQEAKTAPVSTFGGQTMHVCVAPSQVWIHSLSDASVMLMKIRFGDRITSIIGDQNEYDFVNYQVKV